ncbi:DegT/DnrJ/EryC1/StrS family aminotransferase [Spirochaeta thermophila]|uniref:Aminotransferase, DegT/DnrJ/EryC1/StrS family n=1 Tax=Winmispira thermophila (strain ATCC 49972 / DSM 6192 / RI 19.B1) TaxID=665571 RepID=E0RS42_WINT6|nr:DegT/DnrJ/EryC1/StrS family aminotransferase [Spirochaeta thermophila]ADN01829.1 aminotransferase, DegT/DnrJ/EryC1/StrS family [Spirochaeta thermophila DSM 6192]
MSIPLFRPSIRRRDMEAVLAQMVDERLAPGEVSRTFARDLSKVLGAVDGVAFREYERALLTLMGVLELSPGDRILASPLLPAVYGEVWARLGVDVVVADVDPRTGDPRGVEDLVDGVRAVFWNLPLGVVPHMGTLASLGVPLVLDVSQGVGASWEGAPVGTSASYVVVSLESDGIITTGGGAVIGGCGRKEAQVLARVRAEIHFGNLLSDMNAALGMTQLAQLDEFLERRRGIWDVYLDALMRSRHSGFSSVHEGAVSVPWTFPVLLSSERKAAFQYAKKQGVEAGDAFQDTLIACFDVGRSCPGAEELLRRCLIFPLYPIMSRERVQRVARVIASLP